MAVTYYTVCCYNYYLLVHCRLRRVDSKSHALPSTSSNTYWQVEKVDDPTSGMGVSKDHKFASLKFSHYNYPVC